MIIATLDLENADDRQQVNAQWRYADGLVPGEPNGGLVDQLSETPARLAGYDDSGWAICEDIRKGVSKGFCFGWYRIGVTLPEKVGDVDVSGSKVWFATCIDDYGEIWVDDKCDLAFGESGRGAASGFNAPQRVVVSESAEPGTRHLIASLAVNGPFGKPGGGIFLRYARLEFEKE
jgi:hypothetical protein